MGATLAAGTAFGLPVGGMLGGSLFGSVLGILAKWQGLRKDLLLLSGVMLSFFGSSLIAVWMALVDPQTFRGVTYWLMGDVSRADLTESLVLTLFVLFLCFWAFVRARVMDAFLTGDDFAQSLGIRVGMRRAELVMVASFLTAACVCVSGMIGFVGLVAPHFARRWLGSLHGRLVPAVMMLGSLFVLLADAIGRVLVPGAKFAGAETALLGAAVCVDPGAGRRWRPPSIAKTNLKRPAFRVSSCDPSQFGIQICDIYLRENPSRLARSEDAPVAHEE